MAPSIRIIYVHGKNREFIRKLLFIGKKLNSRKSTKKVYLTIFKRKLSQWRNKAI